jgi:RNA polymerase subunit RPABC4/transcription elongation factor Spt4
MTENISNLIVAATSLCGGIVIALIAGLTIWTFRDIRSRSRDILVQILATVMVGVIPVAGIIVYLLLRPRETLAEKYVRALEEESLLASIENQEFCPTCGRRVDFDMQFCPSCHTKLRNACGNCGRAVHLSWDMCPYCGNTLTPETPARVTKPSPKQVPAPNAQFATASLAAGASNAKPKLGMSDMLDRVGGAIGGVLDKMSPRSAQPEPNGQAIDEDVAQPPTPAASNGAPTTKPSAKKPLISREELE